MKEFWNEIIQMSIELKIFVGLGLLLLISSLTMVIITFMLM
jgi:hypothetical protein